MFQAALAALIIFSVGVNFFLFYQMRVARAQLAEQRVAVSRFVMDYQRGSENLIRNFTARMQSYAGSHPDFRPILDKYRTPLAPYFFPVTPPVAQPAQPPGAPKAATGTAPKAGQK